MASSPHAFQYSRSQLEYYIKAIYPETPSVNLASIESRIQKDPLSTLASIQLRHLAFNPWGNVGLHYSPHRTISLSLESLFTKIVERKVGGYCMENNTLFSTLLRSLGYELYTTGARIGTAIDQPGGDPETFAGLGHQVTIVTINNQKYLVDVGFSTYGALQPIPLIYPDLSDTAKTNPTKTYKGIPGLNLRLVHRRVGSFVSTTQKYWVLEVQITNPKNPRDFFPGYCFTDTEFLPQDYEVMNYRTSHDPKSWFTYTFVLTKIVLAPRHGRSDRQINGDINNFNERVHHDATIDDGSDDDLEAIGSITFVGDEISRRSGEHGEEKEVLRKCKNEAERVDALEKWFGVFLNQSEKDSIRGLCTEIKGGFDI